MHIYVHAHWLIIPLVHDEHDKKKYCVYKADSTFTFCWSFTFRFTIWYLYFIYIYTLENIAYHGLAY